MLQPFVLIRVSVFQMWILRALWHVFCHFLTFCSLYGIFG